MQERILKKTTEGGKIKIQKEVVVEYTQQNILEKKQQLIYQQSQIRQQMQQMKVQYETIALQIAELDEDLKSFESEELPTI